MLHVQSAPWLDPENQEDDIETTSMFTFFHLLYVASTLNVCMMHLLGILPAHMFAGIHGHVKWLVALRSSTEVRSQGVGEWYRCGRLGHVGVPDPC